LQHTSTEKELVLKILYLKTLPSTQLYLKEQLKVKQLQAPVAVVANMQTQGIGSRNNEWISKEGNLFLSFAVPLSELPSDLKLESASIYFAYMLKETLTAFGSQVILKWPNDFYIDIKKVGGMITTVVDNNLVCGVGLNLMDTEERFATLDIKIDKHHLLDAYFQKLEKKVLWKQVFSKYKLEFQTNKKFFTHNESERLSLEDVVLEDDGSISMNGERIYSRR